MQQQIIGFWTNSTGGPQQVQGITKQHMPAREGVLSWKINIGLSLMHFSLHVQQQKGATGMFASIRLSNTFAYVRCRKISGQRQAQQLQGAGAKSWNSIVPMTLFSDTMYLELPNIDC